MVNFLNKFLENPNISEFTARIVKKGGNSGLLVEGAIIDSAIEFNSVQFSDNVNTLYDNYVNGKNTDEYTGPDFETLDERLQSELRNYLEGLGINDELASFVEVVSVDKDQRLYSKWLNDVKSFLH